MQKNKCVYEVSLTKQEFVDILNRLREATELVDKVEALFRDSRGRTWNVIFAMVPDYRYLMKEL